MTNPQTIAILSQTFCQVQDLLQLRHTNGPDKGRRRYGLKYYLLYNSPPGEERQSPEVASILVEQSIDDSTDLNFLKSALDLKLLYLHKLDYDITFKAMKQRREQNPSADKNQN
jgi:hypothetical protein